MPGTWLCFDNWVYSFRMLPLKHPATSVSTSDDNKRHAFALFPTLNRSAMEAGSRAVHAVFEGIHKRPIGPA